jgi:hypothetical protein
MTFTGMSPAVVAKAVKVVWRWVVAALASAFETWWWEGKQIKGTKLLGLCEFYIFINSVIAS